MKRLIRRCGIAECGTGCCEYMQQMLDDFLVTILTGMVTQQLAYSSDKSTTPMLITLNHEFMSKALPQVLHMKVVSSAGIDADILDPQKFTSTFESALRRVQEQNEHTRITISLRGRSFMLKVADAFLVYKIQSCISIMNRRSRADKPTAKMRLMVDDLHFLQRVQNAPFHIDREWVESK